MIRIIEELENDRVMIESDAGKLLDIGGGPVRRMILFRGELGYVEEVDPAKAAENQGDK